MRKQYTAAFKAKLVLELLKEIRSLSHLAAEHKVHPNQLRQWRDKALKELPTLFDRKSPTADLVAAHERQTEELYSEIGRLMTMSRGSKKNLASTLPRADRVQMAESCKRSSVRSRGRNRRSGTRIGVVISPARSTLSGCKWQRSRSAWTVRGVRSRQHLYGEVLAQR